MTARKTRRVTALAPWYGSNRTLAPHAAALMAGAKWVGVPFAGGMAEVPHFATATTVMVGDIHTHVMNLAMVVATPKGNKFIRERVAATPYHERVLAEAQTRCLARAAGRQRPDAKNPDYAWALDYFLCAWMGRNGRAGTKGEFSSGMSFRWEAGGGDSATRLRSAAASLEDWLDVMRRCNFVCMDGFAFIGRTLDGEDIGLYVDSPFPGLGDHYEHSFSDADHVRLATDLRRFKYTRVVVRFYDMPVVRKLYPQSQWRWHHIEGGRKSTNESPPEVLLTRNVPKPQKSSKHVH